MIFFQQYYARPRNPNLFTFTCSKQILTDTEHAQAPVAPCGGYKYIASNKWPVVFSYLDAFNKEMGRDDIGSKNSG